MHTPKRSVATRAVAIALAAAAAAWIVALTPATARAATARLVPHTSVAHVQGWGWNEYHQVGNANSNLSSVLGQSVPENSAAPSGVTFIAVSAGYYQSMGLASNGAVYTWGYNAYGALGNGTSGADSASAVKAHLPAGTTVTAISSGGYADLALTSTGKVYAWGDNTDGEVGNNSDFSTPVTSPALVHLPTGVRAVAIATAYDASYALTSTGQVYAWGEDEYNELGDGTTNTTNKDVPVKVHLPAGVTAIRLAGNFYGAEVLDAKGQVWDWGWGEEGELGNGTFTTQTGNPVKVHLPSGITVASVDGGGYVNSLITTSGQLWMWGEGEYNELGDGTANVSDKDLPVRPELPTGTVVIAVAGEGYTSFALTSSGKVYGWGYNYYGEIGNNTAPTSSGDPSLVSLPAGYHPTSISAGGYTALTLDTPAGYDLVGSDGGVFVFGPPSTGFFGSLPGIHVHVNNIVGIVPTVDHRGYFLVGSDGGVFAFGDAPFENSLPGIHVHVNDIVGIVPTADDRGYFLVGADGGVFAFGDAPFENSLPGEHITVHNIVGITPTADDHGYWVVASTGKVYALGDAAFHGSGGGSSPTVSIARTVDGGGYWLVAKDGHVSNFGDAKLYGEPPTLSDAVAVVSTPLGQGYWVFTAEGGVRQFGDASFWGSLPSLRVTVHNVVGGVPTT